MLAISGLHVCHISETYKPHQGYRLATPRFIRATRQPYQVYGFATSELHISHIRFGCQPHQNLRPNTPCHVIDICHIRTLIIFYYHRAMGQPHQGYRLATSWLYVSHIRATYKPHQGYRLATSGSQAKHSMSCLMFVTSGHGIIFNYYRATCQPYQDYMFATSKLHISHIRLQVSCLRVGCQPHQGHRLAISGLHVCHIRAT